MYKLYTDRNEDFECAIEVKNASLKNAFSRIIIESDNYSLVFPGKIEKNKCKVPIKKLKGLLEENAHGKIFLEVVVDDLYFKPWEDKFEVDTYTNLKVSVNEQKDPKKPLVTVNKSSGNKKTLKEEYIFDLVFICERFNIYNKKSLLENRHVFKSIISKYFKDKELDKAKMKGLISEVVNAFNK